MPVLTSILGRVINESRGQPTVEVTVSSDTGLIATASLPLGSSLGRYEAPIVSASQAVSTINSSLVSQLLRQSCDFNVIDQILNQIYIINPEIGVNSLLGISLAVARLQSQVENIPLYQFIRQISDSKGYTLPIPMFNLINGGKHASNNLDFQEYIIIPTSMPKFHEKLEAGRQIFSALQNILLESGYDVNVGYEGGFAPNLSTNEEGLGLLKQAIEKAGFEPGVDVWLGLDVAASSVEQSYKPSVDGYIDLFENFPLLSIEDPFVEDDWTNWQKLKEQLSRFDLPDRSRLLVGDDLFVGNRQRLEAGIVRYSANSLLIKICQSPTLTEILSTIKLAREHNYVSIVSHRSGDTLDSFIADLGVGTAATFIKAGAPNDSAPERMTKYERVVQIEEELGAQS